MKKRILRVFSLLLLVSLLLGAVPAVAASSEVTYGSDRVISPATENSVSDSASDLPECDYSSLYVQEGLVGLFTAFAGGDTVETGVWLNEKEGYGDATLRARRLWQRKDIGVGYRMDLDAWFMESFDVGISLPDSYEDLDTFFVEAFAMVEGVVDEYGDRYVNVYDAETGTGERYGYYNKGASTFRFGLLSSLFFVTLNEGAPTTSLSSRWFLLNRGYPGWNPSLPEGQLLINSDTGWRDMGPEDTPTAGVMQITKQTNSDTGVRYTIAYNGGEPCCDKEIAMDVYQKMLTYSQKDYADRFSLFNGLPSTVYAIRVYNRVLNEEEKRINAFVDKAAYFGIDVSDFNTLGRKTKNLVYETFEHFTMEADAATMRALYDFLTVGDEEAILGLMLSCKGYQPILSGAQGYRVLFELQDSVYNAFLSMGYAVEYGVLLSATNTAPTPGATDVTRIALNGPYGTHLYRDYAGANGRVFSVAVTGEGTTELSTDVTVRAYVELVDEDENVLLAYCDPKVNNVLDGRVSIKDASVYFVNSYSGDVATSYDYMNSAVLRQTLALFGVTGRYSLADDLVMYVDAENGDDGNSGLSADSAYATIACAMAGAKAHLRKTGRKTVTIYLSEGRHYVQEEFTLMGDDVFAESYSITILGEGDSTIVTSEREIDLDGISYDPVLDMSYVQLTREANGKYPNFRALYGDGELLTLAHNGSSEDTHQILEFYIVDANGRKLERASTSNDWQISKADAAIAKYGVMHLPSSLFDMRHPEWYVGAEIHFLVEWTSHILHIDHLEQGAGHVVAYIAYNELASYNEYHPLAGKAMWLENAEGLLAENYDTYYYDSTTGRLYYNEGDYALEDFSTLCYAGLERFFTFTDVQNVTVENVCFTGLDSKYIRRDSGAACGQGARLTLYNRDPGVPDVSYGFMEAAPIFANHINGLTLRNVTVDGTLGSGIVCKGAVENVTIDSCIFTNLGNAAIHLGDASYDDALAYVKGVDITNNYVSNIGTLYQASVAILGTFIANARVVGNTVIGVPYTALSFGWMWATVGSTAEDIIEGEKFDTFALEIAYNYISDFMMCMGDGGAIYLLGGTVLRKTNDMTPYNFMHHNYVNVSEESGRHNGNDLDTRRIMCYYHDNSSSNWLDESNVLIHTANKDTHYYGMFHQSLATCETQNNRCEGNYYIGYDSLLAVYDQNSAMLSVNAKFNTFMSDYVYRSVDALSRNQAVSPQKEYNTECLPSPGNANVTVASIFAAAGSTIWADDKESGLTWGAPAQERVSYLASGVRAQEAGAVKYYRVTLTDGTVTETLQVAKGDTIELPATILRKGYDVYGTVGGIQIDFDDYEVSTDVVVNLVYKPREYPVKFYSEWNGEETVYSYRPVDFGSVLVAPANPESFRDENGDLHVFIRWDGYKEGMTLTTEGASFRAVFRNDGKHFYDDGHDTVCNECGFEREMVHDFYSEWEHEADIHYHVCSGCDERTGEGAHTFDAGTVTKKPTATEAGERTYLCTVCAYARTERIDAPPAMTEAPQTWQQGSEEGLTFRSDALFVDFLSVSLDGATLAATDYTVSEGSTVVTLSAAYLATLSAGEHTLTIHSASGDAAAAFTVTEAPAEDGGGFPFFAVLLPTLAVALLALAFFLLRKKKNGEK